MNLETDTMYCKEFVKVHDLMPLLLLGPDYDIKLSFS